MFLVAPQPALPASLKDLIDDAKQTLTATLAPVPEQVLAEWEAEAMEAEARESTQVAEND